MRSIPLGLDLADVVVTTYPVAPHCKLRFSTIGICMKAMARFVKILCNDPCAGTALSSHRLSKQPYRART